MLHTTPCNARPHLAQPGNLRHRSDFVRKPQVRGYASAVRASDSCGSSNRLW